LFALALPAEAKIVYTPAHINIGGGRVGIDLNHDGIADFFIYVNISSGDCASTLLTRPAQQSNGVVEYGLGEAALKGNRKVGHDSPFGSSGFMAARSDCSQSHSWGPWVNVNKAYVGLKFLIKGKVHYGWARIKMTHVHVGAILTGYAYETIPNKRIYTWPIKTDNVEESDSGPGASLTNPIPATPQPASLGILALGVPGVPLWRRKESVLVGN